MKQFLMRIAHQLTIALVVAVALGVLSGFNGTASASAAPVAPSAPTVSAPAVQLAAQSAPVPASSVVIAPAASAASTYKVAKGDTMGRIAKAKGVKLKSLIAANPQIKNPDRIYPGQVLNLKGGQSNGSDERSDAPAKKKSKSEAKKAEADHKSDSSNGVWDKLAKCESSGNWSINTGNGYYGGVQFSLSSWKDVGGEGYPHKASKAEQIKRAEMLLAKQGWGAWPSCSKKIGKRE